MVGGAEFAYAVAGIYRDRVLSLSFCEMLLSGISLDKWSYFTPENVNALYERRGVWQWHVSDTNYCRSFVTLGQSSAQYHLTYLMTGHISVTEHANL
jgi:hypothetical protein